MSTSHPTPGGSWIAPDIGDGMPSFEGIDGETIEFIRVIARLFPVPGFCFRSGDVQEDSNLLLVDGQAAGFATEDLYGVQF